MADLVVFGDGVAVDLDGGDRFAALKGPRYGDSSTPCCSRRRDRKST
jgi:hypothetical protein